MYLVYILKNINTGKHYIGYTRDIDRRLKEHNIGKTKSIKNRGKYILIYKEAFKDKQTAYKREREIKSYKGGNGFKNLINN